MSSISPAQRIADAVAVQRAFLRNPFPPSDGVCSVCRGAAGSNYSLCFRCNGHRQEAGAFLADVVAPISYSVKNHQHAYNLISYKSQVPSPAAQFSLWALGVDFLIRHNACLSAPVGGPFTHLAAVPSTRGRVGEHPLLTVLVNRIGLPKISAISNAKYDNSDRDFHRDRFSVDPFGEGSESPRVMIIDDTWTTGARVQSLAYALKSAGATGVAAVVLGRHVNPADGQRYEPSRRLMDRIRTSPPFDSGRCVMDD